MPPEMQAGDTDGWRECITDTFFFQLILLVPKIRIPRSRSVLCFIPECGLRKTVPVLAKCPVYLGSKTCGHQQKKNKPAKMNELPGLC